MKEEVIRCFGTGLGKECYADYHDREWGVPVHDDKKLFEMLCLEGAQAGLSWETILKRREAYNRIFFNFDPEKVAQLKDDQLEEILLDPSIIRNRLKIYSVRENAKIFCSIQHEFGSFDVFLWKFVDHTPIVNQWKNFKEIPPKSIVSDAISKELKKRGMKFVGTTILYAFMQAVGMVNDHLLDCSFRDVSMHSYK